MSSDKLEVAGLTLTLAQDSDCCDSNMLPQEIALDMMDGGGGPYWRVKTERWAASDAADWARLWTIAEATLKAAQDAAGVTPEGGKGKA